MLLYPIQWKEWRTEWQQGDFPFFYVQIAPFDYQILPPHHSGGKYNSAYLRDAQRKALDKIPNSGMVSLLDLGEKTSIHPMHKKECGERLAFMALGKTYGIKGIAAEAPTYDTITIDSSTVTVKFKNAKMGLTSYSKEMVNFEIAGKNQVFYPAKAKISRDVVLLTSPEVKEPIAVRYAFKDFVTGDLFSNDGLAISSFRTDDFEK